MVAANKTCLLMAAGRNDVEPAAIGFLLDNGANIIITTRLEIKEMLQWKTP
jgi:hypothetical protein